MILYVAVKRFMITKKSVVEIQNLVVNLKSLPVKLNPDYQSKGTMLKTTKWLRGQIILPRLIKKNIRKSSGLGSSKSTISSRQFNPVSVKGSYGIF